MFSQDSGGTSGRQSPPPGACQHSVAWAASEQGASRRQPSGGSSRGWAARQRFQRARGSAGIQGGDQGEEGAPSHTAPRLPQGGRSLTLPEGTGACPDRVGLQGPHLLGRQCRWGGAVQLSPHGPKPAKRCSQCCKSITRCACAAGSRWRYLLTTYCVQVLCAVLDRLGY